MSRLGAWAELPFFTDVFPALAARIAQDDREILPPRDKTFAALEARQPDTVKVVILGQDPYPTPGHANGLAFSVAPDISPLPPSLRNIFKELQSDIGSAPETGDLSGWAAQGVLLLNTALTVPAHAASAHSAWGWSTLADEVIAHVSATRPAAFVLWGNHAKARADQITGTAHLILTSTHPSPLAASKGFFGSKPFSAVNSWLIERGETPIDWTR
jgi:uracil-DNA glycosylase